MYDDIAGLSVTLGSDGFDRLESIRDGAEPTARRSIHEESGIEETFVLNTCQRCELYAYGSRARCVLAEVGRCVGVDVTPDGGRLLTGEAAVTHLFQVASGLESGVLGEDEVLGQLRDAYHNAVDEGAVNGRLETVISKSIRVGERARTETAINEGAVSLGSVTLDRIHHELAAVEGPDRIADCDVLVVGAGEVAELVVDSIACRTGTDGSVVVANRSRHGAERLAETVDGEAIRIADLSNAYFERADVVVSATGADDRVLTLGQLVGHELIMIDLANPRDVDPAVADLDDISVTTIDEVLAVRNSEIRRREAAIDDVRAIIDEESDRLEEQLRVERVDDTLDRIYSQAHTLRESETERALARLHNEKGEPLTERQETVVRDLSMAIVNKLLHPTTSELRRAAAEDDQETVDTLLRLFDNHLTEE